MHSFIANHRKSVSLRSHKNEHPVPFRRFIHSQPEKLLLRGGLVVVREVAQEQERQHVIAEIVRAHRATQLIGNGPEGFAQLCFVSVGHDSK